MQQVSPLQLQLPLTEGTSCQLIDVREWQQNQVFNTGGELMPLSELFEHSSKIRAGIFP